MTPPGFCSSAHPFQQLVLNKTANEISPRTPLHFTRRDDRPRDSLGRNHALLHGELAHRKCDKVKAGKARQCSRIIATNQIRR